MTRAAALWLCSAWPVLSAAAPPGEDVAGIYRVQGTARVDAAAPLGRRIEARGDAGVRAGAGREVRIRLAAMDHACELVARRSDDGALAFAAGQRCELVLDDPGARGRVEARLRSGTGRLRDRHLALDLAFELAGQVSLRAVPAQLLGVELPSSWLPPMPVDGGAALSAAGDRDESRAAERP